MTSETTVIIASILGQSGPTGVHTHISETAAFFRHAGLRVHVVTPYDYPSSFRRKGGIAVGKSMRRLKPDVASEWNRYWLSHDLARALRLSVGQGSHNTVIYAQDPLSARTALEVRSTLGNANVRVVMMAHFNGSEAEEYVMSNLTQRGSRVWNRSRRLEQMVLPLLDQIVTPSHYLKNILVDRFTGHSQLPPIAVVPNFISDRYQLVAAQDGPKSDLITIGTLEPRKNQVFLLHALEAAARRGARVTLTVIGDGPSSLQYQETATRLGLLEQVNFLGYHPQAYSMMPNAQLYVHAAIAENLPITLIEALAYQRPIIAAPVGGIPEIFSDEVEGLYWDISDADSGAVKILRLLDNREERKRMSNAARNRFRTSFTAEVRGPELLGVVLGPDNGGRSITR